MFCRLYVVLVHEFIIDRLRHVPFLVLRFASPSIPSRVDGWNVCLVHGFFSLGRSALNTLNKMLGIEETSWDVGRARSHIALSN